MRGPHAVYCRGDAALRRPHHAATRSGTSRARWRASRFCDEVVVVDGGSQRPHARARGGRGGARGDERALAGLRGPAQPRALAAARHDWVLALDADERVTPALRDEIRAERRPRLRARRLPHPARRLLPRALDPRHRLVARPAAPPLRPPARPLAGRAHPRVGARGRERSAACGRGLEHFSYADISDHLRDDRPLHHPLGASRPRRRAAQRSRSSRPCRGCWAFLRNYVLPPRRPAGRGRAHRLHAERVLHLREAGQAPRTARTARRPGAMRIAARGQRAAAGGADRTRCC